MTCATCDECWKFHDATLFFQPVPPTTSGHMLLPKVLVEATAANDYWTSSSMSCSCTFFARTTSWFHSTRSASSSSMTFLASGTQPRFDDVLCFLVVHFLSVQTLLTVRCTQPAAHEFPILLLAVLLRIKMDFGVLKASHKELHPFLGGLRRVTVVEFTLLDARPVLPGSSRSSMASSSLRPVFDRNSYGNHCTAPMETGSSPRTLTIVASTSHSNSSDGLVGGEAQPRLPPPTQSPVRPSCACFSSNWSSGDLTCAAELRQLCASCSRKSSLVSSVQLTDRSNNGVG